MSSERAAEPNISEDQNKHLKNTVAEPIKLSMQRIQCNWTVKILLSNRLGGIHYSSTLLPLPGGYTWQYMNLFHKNRMTLHTTK